MSPEVAYPLAIEGLVTIKKDGDPQFFGAFEGQQWAQPSEAHLRQLMRHVVANPQEARAKGRAAREMVRARFTPAVLAQAVERHVRRIQGALLAKQAGPRRGGGGMLRAQGAPQAGG
jgi:hypothetical protein